MKDYINKIVCADSIWAIKNIKSESVHLILSDIPYGISYDEWDVLHNNRNSALGGKSPAQETIPIFQKRGKPINGWSKADRDISRQYYEWCSIWARDWLRVLKPGASCFVFAGRRYAHRCICALEDAGFVFKDMISWQKDAAAHRAQNVSVVFENRGDMENAQKWQGWKIGNLRPIFEPVLWFVKPYKTGTALVDNIIANSVGAYNESALRNNPLSNCGIEICSNVMKCKSQKSDHGLHSAQKPVNLLCRLIELTTLENQVVLDPFCGCGSTLVAARQLNRKFIGIEKSLEYCEIAKKRIEGEL